MTSSSPLGADVQKKKDSNFLKHPGSSTSKKNPDVTSVSVKYNYNNLMRQRSSRPVPLPEFFVLRSSAAPPVAFEAGVINIKTQAVCWTGSITASYSQSLAHRLPLIIIMKYRLYWQCLFECGNRVKAVRTRSP